VHYNLEPVSPGTGSVAVRQRAGGQVTLKDMRDSFATGVDNTGNVCLWPAEEVMAHYMLSRASEFQGKNICELGAGVGLCGLAMARALKTNSLLLTDGNAQVVDTLQRALEVHAQPVLPPAHTPACSCPRASCPCGPSPLLHRACGAARADCVCRCSRSTTAKRG